VYFAIKPGKFSLYDKSKMRSLVKMNKLTAALVAEIRDKRGNGKMPDEELIRELVAKGADVNPRDDFGFNVCIEAICGDEKYDPILKLLLELGADPNLESPIVGGGDTILDQIWGELILEQDGLESTEEDGDEKTIARLRKQVRKLEGRIKKLREMGFEGGGW
jgi:hypothetical protein